MSTVLFLANIPLANPQRGTPQHLCYMFRQIKKEHTLFVCTHSVPEEFRDIFIPYPSGKGMGKLRALKHIVEKNHITHIFTAGQSGLLAPVLLKYLCGVKIADEIHGMGFEELYASGEIGRFRYFYMKWKVRTLLRFYDSVFVMSQKLLNYYASISKGWVLVYGGVDIAEVPDASSRAREEKELVIGYMGNTRAYQGLPYLIEAAASVLKKGILLRLNLIISGDSTELEQLLSDTGLNRVTTMHHNVSHEEAFRLIADSSVVVIPRPSSVITEYAFPGKLAEYLATGIPTIATQIGPIDEMREEFVQYCILIKPDTIAANLADALERVSLMSAQERRILGEKARTYAGERFSWDIRGKIFNERFRS